MFYAVYHSVSTEFNVFVCNIISLQNQSRQGVIEEKIALVCCHSLDCPFCSLSLRVC